MSWEEKAASDLQKHALTIGGYCDDDFYPLEGYFKVEDPEANESGWALCRNHKVILTNEFMNFESGTRLVLENDDYTINIAATRAINKNCY